MNAKLLGGLGVIVGIVVGMGLGYGVFRAISNTPPAVVSTPPPTVPLVPQAPHSNNEVAWHEPQELGDIGIVDVPSTQYFAVGTFVQGKYDKGTLVLVKNQGNDPGGPYAYRVVLQGDKVTLLTKHSAVIYPGDGLVQTRIAFDQNYQISDLVLPATLQGPQPRQILREADGADRGVIFTLQGRKQIFSDGRVGEVYIEAQENTFSAAVSNNLVNRGGFYVRRPDATEKVYALDVDIIG